MIKLVFRGRDFDSVSKSPERILGGEDQEFHFFLDYSRRYSYLTRGGRWYECLMGMVFSAAPGYDPAPSDAFADSQGLNRRGRRLISGLSSYRGGCPCGPRADTSRLIGRDDVAVHVDFELSSKCYFLGKIKWLSSRKPCTRMSDEAVRSVALGLLVVLSGMGGMGVAATT
ncbi:hypothetical protein BHE74_00038884 [Ensete ventricosum]|nr:hypothetical protein BHE74_00038884 [Ensete ventricosum]